MIVSRQARYHDVGHMIDLIIQKADNLEKTYVEELSKVILRRMQRFQRKTAVVLPKLEKASQLELSHKAFDV